MTRPSPAAIGQLHLGCAVWAYPGWRGGFYPSRASSGEMLDLYVRRLNAVEGNTTFYAVPPRETVERWAARMPAGFRFCPKLPREFSHRGELTSSLGGVRDFLEVLAPLRDRLGLVFAQLPPTYGPDRAQDLIAFVEAWPHATVPLGIELRHPDWFDEGPGSRIVPAFRRADTTHVILDTRPIFEGDDDPQAHSRRRKPKLPVRPVATAGRCMVRFVGHPTFERNLPHLAGWAERTADWLREGRDVLFFCHCPQEERSPALARRFHRELAVLVPEIPALPMDSRSEREGQLELF